MVEIAIKSKAGCGLSEIQIFDRVKQSIERNLKSLKKVLLIPPDITRSSSGAGLITAMYYKILQESCIVNILPALGTHMPMTKEECFEFFGPYVPFESLIIHDWRNDVIKIGEIPGEYIKNISEGLMDKPIDVEINKHIIDKSYDLIISIGQVVPHEVAGMANYSKNIFVGCGGSSMINQTHMLGAVHGMERIMGRDHSPVRKVFDYAEENFIKDIPLMYVLTVTTQNDKKTDIEGLFIGRTRNLFEQAVALSQEKNLNFLDKPIKKAVVFLDDKKFKSTWIGNKAIYRTRMAMADDGEIIILAPGVKHFGEDSENDRLIRKYGYVGKMRVLELSEQEDLKNNLSVAAHLIHGSSDDRFSVTYAVEKLSKDEIENVNFKYMDYQDAYKRYEPSKLKDGFNILDNGEEIFYISNPALGLWVEKSNF